MKSDRGGLALEVVRGRPESLANSARPREFPQKAERAAEKKHRSDTELEASGLVGETPGVRPAGAATNQPRATPWDHEFIRTSSPERAAQESGVVSPFQGLDRNTRPKPRALP